MGKPRAQAPRLLRYLTALALVCACGQGPEAVVGRVVAVEGGLDSIAGFTLVTEEGRTFDFSVAPEADRAEFPLVHLRSHLLSGEAVTVTFVLNGDERTAIIIEDA